MNRNMNIKDGKNVNVNTNINQRILDKPNRILS